MSSSVRNTEAASTSQAPPSPQTPSLPGSKSVGVVKTTLRQISSHPQEKKSIGDSPSEVKSRELESSVVFADCLSSLPTEMLAHIAEQCNFKGLEYLSNCPNLEDATQEPRFKRLVGMSPLEALQIAETNAKKYIATVCRRFEALYEEFNKGEVSIPKDAIDLYEQVIRNCCQDEAKKLESFLDARDNLIFWETLGLSQFNMDEADSYLEIENAYSQTKKSFADFSQKNFDLNDCGLTSIPSDLLAHFQIETLELENNHITTLPKKLGENLSLILLNLGSNKLSSLPENFGNLSMLQMLNLDGNELTSLPKSFGKLGKLGWLDLSSNRLRFLPDSFCELSWLYLLRLRGNQIGFLPGSFGKLNRLEILQLRNNELSSLPESFRKLGKLAWLDLSGNRFSSLPDNFPKQGNLKNLSITNQLKKFPSAILQIPNLEGLELNSKFMDSEEAEYLRKKGVHVYNNLKDENALHPLQTQQNQPNNPASISKSTDVVKTTLNQKNVKNSENSDISQDYLSFLPYEMLLKVAILCDFQSLKNLSECSSKLHSIAQETCFKRFVGNSFQKTLQTIELNAKKRIDTACHRFEALAFKKNEASIPKDAIDLYAQVVNYRNYHAAKKLEEFLNTRDNLIFWKKMGLSQFNMDEADSYLEIEKAYSQINKSSADFSEKNFVLNDCKLTSIPSDLLAHFQIEKLYLEKNYITELPKQLGEMLCLKFLTLRCNKLSFLPESFGKLVNLKILDLSCNSIFSLPENLGHLSKLRLLSLAGNRLASLPKSLGKLSHLKEFSAGSNNLTYLPKSLGDLSQLKTLNLSNNRFSFLPKSIQKLQNLKNLIITDPLNEFPSIVLQIPDLKWLVLNCKFWRAKEVESLSKKDVIVEYK